MIHEAALKGRRFQPRRRSPPENWGFSPWGTNALPSSCPTPQDACKRLTPQRLKRGLVFAPLSARLKQDAEKLSSLIEHSLGD
jgi:hypothetical protein